MAALTGDANVNFEGTPKKTTMYAAAAYTFRKGSLVWVDRTSGGATVGYVQNTSIAAGDRILGICAEAVTTTAIGDPVSVYVDGVFSLPKAAGTTAADVGDYLIHDISATQTDNPADCVAGVDATVAANDVMVGRILRIENGQVVIDLKPGAIYDALIGWV